MKAKFYLRDVVRKKRCNAAAIFPKTGIFKFVSFCTAARGRYNITMKDTYLPSDAW